MTEIHYLYYRPRWRAALACGLLAAAWIPATAQAQAPGPESFAKEPKTAQELWDAADYLVRTGQAKRAAPYLDAFTKSKPTDLDLLEIRDRFGIGSVLRLADDPATKPVAKPLFNLFTAAERRYATDPARIQRSIAGLGRTQEEQRLAVDHLREAGPYAVPYLIKALGDTSVSAETHAAIVANMGRLDRPAVPALIAALGSPNGTIAAEVANALAQIGDLRAVPFLTYPASWTNNESPLRDAARRAIATLTGKSFELQPKAPQKLLTDEAWKYERHAVQFPSDQVEVWVWEGDAPAPKVISKSDAESLFGARFAREALGLDPGNRSAQVALLSLALEKAAERVGPGNVARNDPTGAFAAAQAAGPGVLSDVLRSAVADGHYDLAEVAALALGRVTDRDALAVQGATNPLVEALAVPDRRVQFAAAYALVGLNPRKAFPGSSRVVPILARFAKNQGIAKAIVIDGNFNRANGVAATLRALGYDTQTAVGGPQGFQFASDSADVDLIFIEPTQLQGAWGWRDTLTNIRADARTAGLPIFVYGPLSLRDRLGSGLDDFRKTAFVVTPTDPKILAKQLQSELPKLGFRPLMPAERQAYAELATGMLGQIVAQPGNPFAEDVPAIEPALAVALNNPSTSLGASNVLGDVPGIDAQRSLADVVLDPSRPMALRLRSAQQLTRSIQRFGPLLSKDQEEKLPPTLDAEADPNVRSALASVMGALRPSSDAVGRRLRSFVPGRPASPPPATAPPPAPEPTKEDEKP